MNYLPHLSLLKIGLTTFSFGLVVSLVTAPLTLAQESRSFTVIPPSISHRLNPGETTEGVLRVINDSAEPLTFSLSIQDYIVEDNNGTPTFVTDGKLSNKYSAASWIGVSPNRFTLAPKQREDLAYLIKIPKDARPGGHYAAVTYTPDAKGTTTGSGTAVSTVVGTLMYIDVNGEIVEKASVKEFSSPGFSEYAPISLHTIIRNEGDLHIAPYGTIVVKNMWGKVISTQAILSKNIFPQAVREFENIVDRKWMFGSYTAEFTAKYGRQNALSLTASSTFWVIPWKMIVIIILAVAVGILGVLMINKKKTNSEETKETEGNEAKVEETPSETTSL